MASTLDSYVTLVKAEVDDQTTRSQNVIIQKVKETYQDVVNRTGKWIVGFSTEDVDVTAETASYTPSSEIQRLHKAYFKADSDSDYRIIHEMTWDDYLRVSINHDSSSPTRFAFNGAKIVLFPTPVENGTLRLISRPVTAELTGTSIIPTRFNRVIVLGAAFKFYAHDDNPKSPEYKSLFESELNMMIDELSTRGRTFRPKLR